jgi:hypothetical protein
MRLSLSGRGMQNRPTIGALRGVTRDGEMLRRRLGSRPAASSSDAGMGMPRQPQQNISQVRFGVDAVHLTARDQRIEHREVPAGDVVARKEVVLPTHRDTPQRAFARVVIRRESTDGPARRTAVESTPRKSALAMRAEGSGRDHIMTTQACCAHVPAHNEKSESLHLKSSELLRIIRPAFSGRPERHIRLAPAPRTP